MTETPHQSHTSLWIPIIYQTRLAQGSLQLISLGAFSLVTAKFRLIYGRHNVFIAFVPVSYLFKATCQTNVLQKGDSKRDKRGCFDNNINTAFAHGSRFDRGSE